MSTRALLWCGILSSVWYAIVNAVVPFFYPGYSMLDLTVSELSAIGAPTRTLWIILLMPYLPLFAAFGWGVMRMARDSRVLRITGYFILLYSAFNLYWPPMHMREVLAAGGGTLTDTLHLVFASVTVALFITIMCLGAYALGSRFRIFTFASLVALVLFGILTATQSPNVALNLPTPLIGLYERINIGVFLAWVAVFAWMLLKREADRPSDSPIGGGAHAAS